MILLCFVLSCVVGCGKKEKTMDFTSETLEQFVKNEDGIFLPGKTEWKVSKEELIQEYGWKEEDYEILDDGRLIARNKMINLGEKNTSVLSYFFEGNELVKVEVALAFEDMDKMKDHMQVILDWAREDFNHPTIDDGSVPWEKGTKEIIKNMDTILTYSWDGIDGSFCSMDFVNPSEDNKMIQIQITAPIAASSGPIVIE